MHAPIVHLVERRPFQYDSGTQADKMLGPLRPRLAAGERIGVMIGSTASAENRRSGTRRSTPSPPRS